MVNKKGNEAHDAVWERVCTLYDKWVELLHMQWWHLTLYRVDSRGEETDETAADTIAKWNYRQASVRVYMPSVANHTDEDLEDIIVHELVHILISPMESAVAAKHANQCEMAVENIARALVDVHRASHAA